MLAIFQLCYFAANTSSFAEVEKQWSALTGRLAAFCLAPIAEDNIFPKFAARPDDTRFIPSSESRNF